MNLREQILEENSKRNWQLVANYIGDDQQRLTEFMELYFTDVYRVVQRASQIVNILCDRNPEMMHPYLIRMVRALRSDPIDAVKRNVMRTFQFLPIPEEVEGNLFDFALNYLGSSNEPIAVRAFSMTTARRICEKYPELANELIPAIEILVKENISAGLNNRSKKELKKLAKVAAGH